MVATSHPLASQAGLDILKSGGNAVDAAIAANACLGLMEPTGCGIGGDLFAMVWSAKDGRLYGLNASGRSAGGVSYSKLVQRLESQNKRMLPRLGPLSVTVPGAVDGWFSLLERFGSLDIQSVLAPAIFHATDGFPLTEVISDHWNRSISLLEGYPGFIETFTDDRGEAPKKGEVWRNPGLADTYRRLAKEGRDVFYSGEIAREMASFLESVGALIRYEDFAQHESDWVEPISVNYRGYDLWELPPNGQGVSALQILNILEGFDMGSLEWGSADHVHLVLEAKKLAFEDRAVYLADPAFSVVPTAWLISKEYAAERRKLIDMTRASTSVLSGRIPRPEDTVYLCTADADGNMVSLIQSNCSGMGSGLCPPGLGFGFQNRGMAFSMEPGHANQYQAGKRPFHTIIPAFVTREDRPLMAFGVMGGEAQPQMHAQIILNLIDYGMNLQEAGDAPRIFHSGSADPNGTAAVEGGGCVSLESGFPFETVNELELKGHCFVGRNDVFGGYQAIWRDPESGVYRGASESRKDGHAVGF